MSPQSKFTYFEVKDIFLHSFEKSYLSFFESYIKILNRQQDFWEFFLEFNFLKTCVLPKLAA